MANVPIIQSVRAAWAFRQLHWREAVGVLSGVAVTGALDQALQLSGTNVGLAVRIVSLLCVLVAYGALLRLAFADEHPNDPEFRPGPYGFQWGKPEMRLLGVAALLIFLLLLASLTLVFVIFLVMVTAGVGAITAQTTPESVMAAMGPGGQIALTAAVLAFGLGCLVLSIRLTIAPAATVALKRIQVFEVWPLTRGQFLRILAATLLVSVPSILAGVFTGMAAAMTAPPTPQGQPLVLPLPEALLVSVIPNLVAAFIVLPMSVGLIAYLYRGLRPTSEVPR
jgi:hypothetical protein